jgi:hypothetical protein
MSSDEVTCSREWYEVQLSVGEWNRDWMAWEVFPVEANVNAHSTALRSLHDYRTTNPDKEYRCLRVEVID